MSYVIFLEEWYQFEDIAEIIQKIDIRKIMGIKIGPFRDDRWMESDDWFENTFKRFENPLGFYYDYKKSLKEKKVKLYSLAVQKIDVLDTSICPFTSSGSLKRIKIFCHNREFF